MSGRDISDVLLLIPCCKSKHGNGPHPAIVSPPLDSELSPSALTMLNEGRRQVVADHRDSFDFTQDVYAAMVWYTGIMYETPGFRDALDAAFQRGLHCLIVSAGYGLLRPDDPIHYYDLKMEKTLGIWRRKLPQILEDYISRIGVRRVFGALLAKYYEAVAGAQGRLSGVELRRYVPCNPGRGQRRALEALGRAVIDLVRSDFTPDERWELEPTRNASAGRSPRVPVRGSAAPNAVPGPTEAERAPGRAPRKADFEAALAEVFTEAESAGKPYVDVEAGKLHRQVGGYEGSGGNHRMATCSGVMWAAKLADDEVLRQPKKGKGASLKIRYKLPRVTGAVGERKEGA